MDVTPEVARGHATTDVATRRLQDVLGSPWVWPYGALGLLLVGVTWPAWVTTNRLVVGADTVLIHYPWFVLWRDAFAAGVFALWNPYSFVVIPAFFMLYAV
jgi:hypothetical protein